MIGKSARGSNRGASEIECRGRSTSSRCSRACSGVEAKTKPVKKPAKPKKSTKVKAADTSNGSNGANNGGNDTCANGVGNNGDPGAPAGGDKVGDSVTQPPVTGGTNKQPTLNCTTKGDVAIAGPAGSPPTVIPGGKT